MAMMTCSQVPASATGHFSGSCLRQAHSAKPSPRAGFSANANAAAALWSISGRPWKVAAAAAAAAATAAAQGWGICGAAAASGGRRPTARCSLSAGSGPAHLALREAAVQVVKDHVGSSTVVGVGGGPGALMALENIAQRIEAGTLEDITIVPSSAMVAAEAANYGIPMATLGPIGGSGVAVEQVDVTIMDADVAQEGTLFAVIGRRGVAGRGALVKEKALAQAAKTCVLIVGTDDFHVDISGDIPVEIEQVNWLDIAEEIDDLFIGDAEVWRRPAVGEAGPLGGDFPFVTEAGHYVLDVKFPAPIPNLEEVAELISSVPGVAAHGVLLREASVAAVAHPEGVKVRTALFRESFTTPVS